jgi:hypothetical protein
MIFYNMFSNIGKDRLIIKQDGFLFPIFAFSFQKTLR